MEKKKPSYLLPDVLAIVAVHGVDAFTETALRGAWDSGLTSDGAVAVVLARIFHTVAIAKAYSPPQPH